MKKCEKCEDEARWTVTAAYLPNPDVQRMFATYPAPMYVTCDKHLTERLLDDIINPGSTMGWLITPYL